MSDILLAQTEGDTMRFPTPRGTAHIARSLIDTHAELVRSMTLANAEEWSRHAPTDH